MRFKDDKRDKNAKSPSKPRPRVFEHGFKGDIDYKDLDLLRKFITSSSKLMSRKRTGMSAQQQTELKQAVKRARFMALLPYTGSKS